MTTQHETSLQLRIRTEVLPQLGIDVTSTTWEQEEAVMAPLMEWYDEITEDHEKALDRAYNEGLESVDVDEAVDEALEIARSKADDKADEAFDEGYQEGFDEGYLRGCEDTEANKEGQ